MFAFRTPTSRVFTFKAINNQSFRYCSTNLGKVVVVTSGKGKTQKKKKDQRIINNENYLYEI